MTIEVISGVDFLKQQLAASETPAAPEPTPTAADAAQAKPDSGAAGAASVTTDGAAGSDATDEKSTPEEGAAAEGAESDDHESDDAPEPGKPPRLKGYKRKAILLQERLEQERDYNRKLQERLTALESSQNKPDAAKPQAADAKPEGKPVEPLEDDFETPGDYRRAYSKYVDELTDFKAKKVREEIKLEQQAAIAQQEFAAVQNKFKESVTNTKKLHPDYEDRIEGAVAQLAANGVDLTPQMEHEIITSASGAELLYALAEDPKELARLCGMAPGAAVRELARLDGRLMAERASKATNTKESQPKRAKPQGSNLKPMEPVAGGASGAAGTGALYASISDMPQHVYEAKRRSGEIK